MDVSRRMECALLHGGRGGGAAHHTVLPHIGVAEEADEVKEPPTNAVLRHISVTEEAEINRGQGGQGGLDVRVLWFMEDEVEEPAARRHCCEVQVHRSMMWTKIVGQRSCSWPDVATECDWHCGGQMGDSQCGQNQKISSRSRLPLLWLSS